MRTHLTNNYVLGRLVGAARGCLGVRRRSHDRADPLDRQVSPSELCEVGPSPRRSGFGRAGARPSHNGILLRTRTAFSLIEVTLALVVMAIGLIAILGLIPQGVTSSRSAADNTLVATIVHDTFSQMRQQTMQSGSTWPTVSGSQHIYYDAAGTNQFIAPSADTYFDVQLVSQVTPSLLTVTATVTWPVKSVTAKPLNTNIFFTSIANYQH